MMVRVDMMWKERIGKFVARLLNPFFFAKVNLIK